MDHQKKACIGFSSLIILHFSRYPFFWAAALVKLQIVELPLRLLPNRVQVIYQLPWNILLILYYS